MKIQVNKKVLNNNRKNVQKMKNKVKVAQKEHKDFILKGEYIRLDDL